MKGKRKFLQEGLKSCELGGWEWRWSYRDLVLADMAFWLFQRSSVGYWSVALGWEFRGVWGVKVPVLSVWTCTWSGPAFHLVLVPVASSCCLQEHGRAGPLPRHRKSPAIPQSLRGSGTNCPPCCDLRTTKRREVYRNWGAFSMWWSRSDEATWHFHRFLLLHPFFYSCPRPVAQGAACLCPPQPAKTRSGTLTRQFIVKNNPVGPSLAALNRGQIFPAVGDP